MRAKDSTPEIFFLWFNLLLLLPAPASAGVGVSGCLRVRAAAMWLLGVCPRGRGHKPAGNLWLGQEQAFGCSWLSWYRGDPHPPLPAETSCMGVFQGLGSMGMEEPGTCGDGDAVQAALSLPQH